MYMGIRTTCVRNQAGRCQREKQLSKRPFGKHARASASSMDSPMQEQPKEEEEEVEFMPLTDSSAASREKHDAVMAKLETQKRSKTMALPTDDREVKTKFRILGEPICLFGEGPGERRDRLRDVLSRLDENERQQILSASARPAKDRRAAAPHKREVFYTEGPKELKEIRKWLITYSIPRSQYRLTQLKRKRDEAVKEAKPDEDREPMESTNGDTELNTRLHDKASEAHLEKEYIKTDGLLRDFGLVGTVRGDERPLSAVRYTPDGKILLTSSWTGQCKGWDSQGQKHMFTLRGHKDRCHDIAVSPISATRRLYATSSADKTVIVYGEDGLPVHTLNGHLSRVNRIDFHPSGRLLASSSHDASWKLWDVEKGVELLDQEGHSRAVHDVKLHSDGALAVSGGYDAFGRLWDLRSGRNIMILDGHIKPIISVGFNPSGNLAITGSEDHTAKIWDLRKRRCVYTILAHSAMITSAAFFPSPPVWMNEENLVPNKFSSEFLMTTSMDGTCRIWSSRDYSIVKVLPTPGEKVMGAAVDMVNGAIATAHYDRNFRLWGPETL